MNQHDERTRGCLVQSADLAAVAAVTGKSNERRGRFVPPGLAPAARATRVMMSVLGVLITAAAVGAESPGSAGIPADQLDFFEAKVRPLLVEHCYQCHSAGADEIEAGLVLDSKVGWETGGDSGPAIVPGQVEQSLLIEAIRYQEDVVSGMPPKSKLADEQIAILEKWVEIGAPDPRTDAAAVATTNPFDLQQRVEQHWCWRPIAAPTPPAVGDSLWSRSPVDRFVFDRLQQVGLRPAPPAARRTWLRRVYLDVIGLPPTPAQIKEFLADRSPDAYRRVVDRLLQSPAFGEKWARHWMDLVRYSETYGHEFDYPIRYAHEYRDYLIRAFNADIPYDQFVREQIAGDMIANPRRHPTADFNESIIGTGFWYFHDATHAPTDSLGNEADIINNQLDVFGKSFLGLTVACARCHDHKFDAISTADYYALSAYLQSSCRQHAPLDPGRKIASLNEQIEPLCDQADAQLQALADQLARDQEWRQRLAADLDGMPAAAGSGGHVSDGELLQDFASDSLPSGWTTSGPAFVQISDQLLNPEGNALRQGTVSSRRLGRKQRGILRSPTFELTKNNIHLRIKATANTQVLLIIDNYQMAPYSALLFKGTLLQGKETETDGRWIWKTLGGDLQKYVGHKAYLEFIDQDDGYIEIDEIRLSDGGPPKPVSEPLDSQSLAERLAQGLASLQRGHLDAFTAWLIDSGKLPVADLVAEARQLADQVPAPRYVLAMAEGTTENAHIYIRGSHKSLGREVPPRSLLALGGQPASRLELANQVASADNPLTARVIVNRIWHHLFGRGIVPTVDDFGHQGEPPSHPELLDHLASDLITQGWSLKRMIGKLVLSQTYRQQSVPHGDLSSAQLATADPTNRLLHKMPVKRLPAETIRDSVLAISGQLNTVRFGPAVPTHLTSFMTGRGRPQQSGPLDGDGRRSVYLAITRNFLNPFMLTFDTPSPFGPQGRRSRSNVPAQALTLLNDPFVIDQAGKWAAQALSIPGLDDRSRAALMMEQAHGVAPTPHQADLIQEFLATQAIAYGQSDHRAWTDLAHSLLNMKAFYYVR